MGRSLIKVITAGSQLLHQPPGRFQSQKPEDLQGYIDIVQYCCTSLRGGEEYDAYGIPGDVLSLWYILVEACDEYLWCCQL